ncbi:MAG: YlmH/Sll1252 family protein [Eubacteriales bacterium]
MDKSQLLNQYSRDKESRMLFASALDKYSLTAQKNIPSSTAFFSPEEQGDFSLLLEKIGNQNCRWWGGYEGATRKICSFLPDWQEEMEEVPLVFLEGTCHNSLGHRDVLGSLMGLGLSRRKMGDILILDHRCQVVVLEETASLILSQWESVGRQSISLKEIPLLEVPEINTKEILSTVASLRLDAMVATGFSLSRAKAVGLISGGKVFVNHRECSKADFLVGQGDLLTCRGLGNCKVEEVRGQSKKGRTVVVMGRYV